MSYDLHAEFARKAWPTEDGVEIEIIRREMEIARGVSLHWTDRDGHVLPYPMTTAEASQKGIEV